MHSLWPSSCRVDFRTTLCFVIPSRSPQHCHRLTLPLVHFIVPSRTHTRYPSWTTAGVGFTPWQLLGPHSASRETKDLNRRQTCSLASTSGVCCGGRFLKSAALHWVQSTSLTTFGAALPSGRVHSNHYIFGTKLLCWIVLDAGGNWGIARSKSEGTPLAIVFIFLVNCCCAGTQSPPLRAQEAGQHRLRASNHSFWSVVPALPALEVQAT